MVDSIQKIFDSMLRINNANSVMYVCMAVLVAFVLGLIIFFTYKLTCRAFAYDSEFGVVILIVPIVVALLLSVIGNDIARAFSLAGALSIIRYRSTLVTPKNIAFIFFCMGAGFITGVGLYLAAFLFVVITCVVILLYTAATSDKGKPAVRTLIVAVPESINYDGLLDEVLGRYTASYALSGIRIISGGTVVELQYHIKLKNLNDVKGFLDEIRVLNANFKIQLTQFMPDRIA